MKLRKEASLVFMSTALLTVLAACAAAPEVTLESSVSSAPEESAASAEQTVDSSKLSHLDLADVQAFLPEEDWEAFTEYLPVVSEGERFHWVGGPYRDYEAMWEPRDVTMAEYCEALWAPMQEEVLDVPEELTVYSLAMVDLDDDDAKELILWVEDVGHSVLVLRQVEDEFYGTDFPIRWFELSSRDGVYVGSGGADASWYYKLSFQDGRFVQRELGFKVGESCEIDGKSVTVEEFTAWQDEIFANEVNWYYPPLQREMLARIAKNT